MIGSNSMRGVHTSDHNLDSFRSVPDSRPPSVREIVKLEKLWGFEEPEPMQWLVQDFIPNGFCTILAADGGSGKSFLALYLAACVASGQSFLGLNTIRGNVLYLDFELQVTEQRRRMAGVLRGMGMDQFDQRIEERLHYWSPQYSLMDELLHQEMKSILSFYEIDLVVLDSLSIGLGADASSQKEVTDVLGSIREWGVGVLCIDHIPANARHDLTKARPYGSTFKFNGARVVFTMAKLEKGGRLLRCIKNNFGKEKDVAVIDQRHTATGEVVFKLSSFVEGVENGALDHMTTLEVSLAAVQHIFSEEDRHHVTADDVVSWRQANEKTVELGTVRNHLTRLKRNNQIEAVGKNQYRPFTIPDSMGGMNREKPQCDSFELGIKVDTDKGLGTVKDGPSVRDGRIPVDLQGDLGVEYFDPSGLKAVINSADISGLSDGTHI